MATPSLRVVDHQTNVLLQMEEELVQLISQRNSKNIAKSFSDVLQEPRTKNIIDSLDYDRLESILVARYLVGVICKGLKSDIYMWAKFLECLNTMGGSFKLMSKSLKAKLERAMSGIVNSRDDDIILILADGELLTELLSEIAYKWENIAIALNIPRSVRKTEQYYHHDVTVSLNNIITSWLSDDAGASARQKTIHTLKKVICGNLVKENDIGEKLLKRFKEYRIQMAQNISSTRKITYPFDHAEVTDGKSMLLTIQGSSRDMAFQWMKDGQDLEDGAYCCGVINNILVIKHARRGSEGKYSCRMSGKRNTVERNTVESNSVDLSVIYSLFKKRLLNLYTVQTEVPLDSWPPVGTKTFINLAIINSDMRGQYSISKDADTFVDKKEKVKYCNIFEQYENNTLILVAGRPGSGKTTLAWKIIKDWSQGKVLLQAKLVFFIPLKLFCGNEKQEGLSDILKLFYYSSEQELEAAMNYVTKYDGEEVCFIIDGLDEYHTKDKRNSIIYKLILKKFLPKAMVIVCSRPAALQYVTEGLNVKQKRMVEVLGFLKAQIFEYIDSFPFDTDPSKNMVCSTQLKDYLRSHLSVFHMCYLPVHVAMICFLFREQQTIPTTQTKLYEQFTTLLIIRHLRRQNHDESIVSLTNLRGHTKTYFQKICKLAYDMTMEYTLVVTNAKIKETLHIDIDDNNSLSLLTIGHTIKLYGVDKISSFLHLTLQEFLTAYYLARFVHNKMTIKDLFHHQLSSAVKNFYSGLFDFSDKNALLVFQYMLKREKNTLDMLHYAFESQQKIVCDEVMRSLKGMFVFSNTYSLMSDFSAVSYVISTSSEPVKEIILPFGEVSSTFLRALHSTNLDQLQSLEIKQPLNNDDMPYLAGVLARCSNLERADLSFLQVTPEAVESVARNLVDCDTLEFIHISFLCPINSTVLLCRSLSQLADTTISIKFQNSHDIHKIVTALKHLKSNLLQINLVNIDLDDGEFLSTPTRIQSLSMLNCKISTNSIVDGLKYLQNLVALNLSNTNIGCSDADSTADALQHMTMLTQLNLSNSNIGHCGACSLAHVLKYNTKLTKLDLSNNHIRDDGAKSLADHALPHLRCLTILNLRNNQIGDYNTVKQVITSLNTYACVDMWIDINNIYDFLRKVEVVTVHKSLRLNGIQVPPRTEFDISIDKYATRYGLPHKFHCSISEVIVLILLYYTTPQYFFSLFVLWAMFVLWSNIVDN